MVESQRASVCICGHAATLHDQHGCAAFLGAFAQTRGVDRYCGCRRARTGDLELRAAVPEADVVADVRVKRKPGAAIAVCEFPPVLELGTSEDGVLAAIADRLRETIAEPADGHAQYLRVLRERGNLAEIQIVALRSTQP